jgi:hypothetical protein
MQKMAIELGRRSFLVGVFSALAAPALAKMQVAEKLLGGDVLIAPVDLDMAWRRVCEISFTCNPIDGVPLEGRGVGINIGRVGAELPMLRCVINQNGGYYNWTSGFALRDQLVFIPESPMVITCDPAPKDCEPIVDIRFIAKNERPYFERLVWRGDRLISSDITPMPMWVGEKPQPREMSDEELADLEAMLDAEEAA